MKAYGWPWRGYITLLCQCISVHSTTYAAYVAPLGFLHYLWHAFASHAVLRGVPLPVVSRLLGHKRPNMTLRYPHFDCCETEAAAERIGLAIARALGDRDASSSD